MEPGSAASGRVAAKWSAPSRALCRGPASPDSPGHNGPARLLRGRRAAARAIDLHGELHPDRQSPHHGGRRARARAGGRRRRARNLATTRRGRPRRQRACRVPDDRRARRRFDRRAGAAVQGGLEATRGTMPRDLAADHQGHHRRLPVSAGNAFSTRTASQIVQEQFQPARGQPARAARCSACSSRSSPARTSFAAPRKAAIGPEALAARACRPTRAACRCTRTAVVGGVGVIADGVYGLDLDITDIDQDLDELIAVAGTRASPRRPTSAPTASRPTAAPSATWIRNRSSIQSAPGRRHSPALRRARWSPSPAIRRQLRSSRRGLRHRRVGHPRGHRRRSPALGAYVLVDAADVNASRRAAGTDGGLQRGRSARAMLARGD